MKEFLRDMDDRLYQFLMEQWEVIPKRTAKWLAYYFPDARVRKRCLARLNVFLGEGTYANIGLVCVNDADTPIHIGNHVSIAPNCLIVACSEANNGSTINDIPYVRDVLTKRAPVTVEDEVWIGAHVTILPGVTVRHHCVIGAGCVVTKSTEPYGVYAGAPARRIRDLREDTPMFMKEQIPSPDDEQMPPPPRTFRRRLILRGGPRELCGEAA